MALAAELNIYSARHYDADFEIYKKFEAATGIKVNHTTANAAELIKRLKLEGKTRPRIFLLPQMWQIWMKPKKLKY